MIQPKDYSGTYGQLSERSDRNEIKQPSPDAVSQNGQLTKEYTLKNVNNILQPNADVVDQNGGLK